MCVGVYLFLFSPTKQNTNMLFSYLFSQKVGPKTKDGKPEGFFNILLTYVFWIIALAITLGAVMLSLRCNAADADSTKRIIVAVLAAIFPEIFLVYFALRKYVFKDTSFCPGI
jgi:hypothetical protein